MHHQISSPNTVPTSLKNWFIFHFWADMLFAIPLFIAPTFTLTNFGFTVIDPLTARIVASAFLAIGGSSYLLRNKGVETYSTLLTLKIIWSSFAIFGTILAIIQGAPLFAFAIIGIYLLFLCAWIYYKRIM